MHFGVVTFQYVKASTEIVELLCYSHITFHKKK